MLRAVLLATLLTPVFARQEAAPPASEAQPSGVAAKTCQQGLTAGVLAFERTVRGATEWKFGGNQQEVAIKAAKLEWQAFMAAAPKAPPSGGGGGGDGIVMCAGGKYLLQAYVSLTLLRKTGCVLPVQIWYSRDMDKEIPGSARKKLEALGNITFVDLDQVVADVKALEVIRARGTVQGRFYALKVLAIAGTTFDRALLLDADNHAVRDPAFLFTSDQFKATGAIFWPDVWVTMRENTMQYEGRAVKPVFGFDDDSRETVDSGQLMVDKTKHWDCIMLTMYIVLRGDRYFTALDGLYGMGSTGDKQAFPVAWKALRKRFTQVTEAPAVAAYDAGGASEEHASKSRFVKHRQTLCGMTMVQHVPVADAKDEGTVLFLHRNVDKWKPTHALDRGQETRPPMETPEWRTWNHVFRWTSRRAVEFAGEPMGPAGAMVRNQREMKASTPCVQYQGPTTTTSFVRYLARESAKRAYSAVVADDIELLCRAAVRMFREV